MESNVVGEGKSLMLLLLLVVVVMVTDGERLSFMPKGGDRPHRPQDTTKISKVADTIKGYKIWTRNMTRARSIVGIFVGLEI